MRRRIPLTLVLAALLLVQATALGHAERESEFPSGDGSVPEYRTDGPALVVCKPETPDLVAALPPEVQAVNLALLDDCAFEHIQAAVNAVTEPGTRILVMPGVYREEPSLAPPSPECAPLADRSILEYAEHVQCPNLQNLIAILGDDPADADRSCTTEPLCRLQVEGTGASPYDVVIDGAWHKLNVVRADRADGVYFKNLLVQRSTFNALYVLETDGFVIDTVVGRMNEEYAFLTFTVDHGLIKDCETYYNGDAGIYPGSAADNQGAHPSVEITRCNSHHNMAGYSGTAGNSVYVHDNDFHHNSIGIVMDSLFPNHPGLPQDSGTFVRNRIYSNNVNHYDNFLGDDAPCFRAQEDRDIENGTVCPTAPVPVGSGIMVAGGNANLFAENWIWDNWRYGTIVFGVPAFLREEYDPTQQFDTSHFNRQVDNTMGLAPDGTALPNGLDFWWDEGGAGNCWQENTGPAPITSDPPAFLLPDCDDMPVWKPASPAKIATLAPCALYDRHDNTHPDGCTWMEDPEQPGGPSTSLV